jgi:hypothetical protein
MHWNFALAVQCKLGKAQDVPSPEFLVLLFQSACTFPSAFVTFYRKGGINIYTAISFTTSASFAAPVSLLRITAVVSFRSNGGPALKPEHMVLAQKTWFVFQKVVLQ